MLKKNKLAIYLTLGIIFLLIISNNSLALLPNSEKFNIKSSSIPTKNWTVILYCGGDEEEPNPIYDELLDILLNKLSYDIDLSAMNIVCLYDYCESGCFFGHVISDGGKARLEILEEYDELNMGDQSTLQGFLNRCKNEYPAERYFLQMIGHAGGFTGANFDSRTISSSEITSDELEMYEIKNAVYNSLGRVDILAQTGCYMGMIECAYEFKDITDVYISSEDIYNEPLVPINVLQDLKILQENTDETNYEIGIKIVNNLKNYATNPSFTLSAIRSDKLYPLALKINELADFLIDNLAEHYSKINKSVNNCKYYVLGVDIYDFFNTAISESSPVNKALIIKNLGTDFKELVNQLKVSLDEAVIAEVHNYRNNNVNGLTIFFSDPEFIEYYDIELDFFDDTNHWLEFLDSYLNYKEPPQIYNPDNDEGKMRKIMTSIIKIFNERFNQLFSQLQIIIQKINNFKLYHRG